MIEELFRWKKFERWGMNREDKKFSTSSVSSNWTTFSAWAPCLASGRSYLNLRKPGEHPSHRIDWLERPVMCFMQFTRYYDLMSRGDAEYTWASPHVGVLYADPGFSLVHRLYATTPLQRVVTFLRHPPRKRPASFKFVQHHGASESHVTLKLDQAARNHFVVWLDMLLGEGLVID